MKVAIALAHGHASKWLQVALTSLKKHKNTVESDIFIADTWPGHPSLMAVSRTELGKGVTVIPCQRRKHSHATGLDEILDHITGKGYDYVFTCETDCMAIRDGWLDWYVTAIQEGTRSNTLPCGMVGFFWEEGNRHYNINPSGTLYLTEMLVKYHKEVRENNEGMFWHPRGDMPDSADSMDAQIKEVAGVFSETRGVKDPTDIQKDQILKGVPQAAWFEPGSYLYYRSLGEYSHVRVKPLDHIYIQVNGFQTPEATYYGGKSNPLFIHWWGGTRAWDHLKHPVTDGFVKACSPFWLDREHRIWMDTVPKQYALIVDAIYEKLGIYGMGYDLSGTPYENLT